MSIIFGAIAYALTVSSCTNPNPGTGPGATSDSSARLYSLTSTPDGYIVKDTANMMIGSYLESVAGDSGASVPNVRSFILDAALLRHYLENEEIAQVKVMLAHTPESIHSGGNTDAGFRSDALTIVVAGFDLTGDYVYWGNDMVPNHATPCPRNCPESGSAANYLLQ